MPYIVTDGTNYIQYIQWNSKSRKNKKSPSARSRGMGEYSITTDISRAFTWEKEKSAMNFLKSLPSKAIKTKERYRVIEKPLPLLPVIGVGETPPTSSATSPTGTDTPKDAQNTLSGNKNSFKEEDHDHPTVTLSPTTLSPSEVYDLIQNKEGIQKKVSVLDRKQEDLLHQIEFEKMDAYNGYLAYKRLHLLRKERRICKNQLKVVEAVEGMGLLEFLRGDLSNTVQEICTQKYHPRVLTEEFKDKDWCELQEEQGEEDDYG